ncbi:hypothetical protein Tco_0882005 [Tanacetum coccineum]
MANTRSEVQAQIRRIFLDGYGVLDVRISFFIFLRLSSRMRYLHGINDAIKVVLFDVITIYLKSKADHAAGGKLLDKNAKESWDIIENLILFDHESWDDPRDFA